jgi:hypothetical protein
MDPDAARSVDRRISFGSHVGVPGVGLPEPTPDDLDHLHVVRLEAVVHRADAGK